MKKTVRSFLSLALPFALAVLFAAAPLSAALPDAEMAGADGSGVPAAAPEKKPTPKSSAMARKHRAARSDKRAPRDSARGASPDRSSSLETPKPARDSSSRPS